METEQLVTVILTVYKRIEYLEVALKSVLSQTLTQFEVIIADDSGERAAEPLYNAYKNDSRLIYQPNSKTLGIVSSVKKSLENSRGVFIAIINDDDCWEPEFLEKLVRPLQENSNIVLAFSDHWIIDAHGTVDAISTDINTIQYKRGEIGTGEISDPKKLTLVDNGIPLAMASVFRKSAIEPAALFKEVVGAYDFWISCLLAASGKPFYYVNERLTRYRIHPKMETGRRSIDKEENMVYIFNYFLNNNLFPEYIDFVSKRLSFYLYKVGRDNLTFGQYGKARNYFKKSNQIKPNYKALAAFAASYLPKNILENTRLINK